MKNEMTIKIEENVSTIENIIRLSQLDTEIDIVLRANKMISNCIQSDSVIFNKKMNLSLDSRVGMLMAIGKNL